MRNIIRITIAGVLASTGILMGGPAHAESPTTAVTITSVAVGGCQPTNGRSPVLVYGVNSGDTVISELFAQTVRVVDSMPANDAVATDIEPGEKFTLVLGPDSTGRVGLVPGTWAVSLTLDAAHTTVLAKASPDPFVPETKGCSLSPVPAGDPNAPPVDPPGIERPPDATGDLQVLKTRKHQTSSKTLLSWNASGVDHGSRLKLMIQPPKMKTLIPIFTVEPGEVGSKIVKYRHQKRLPRGTRIKLWVEHLRIDNNQLIWVCLDQVTIGKKRSGCPN
jgi:hypothetical protein